MNRLVKIYPYKNLDGSTLFEVCRYEPKTFRQRIPDGHGNYTWSLKGIEPVLYRLPEIMEAKKTEPIIVTEGEKDVDNLVKLGYQATTCAMGGGKWRLSYSFYLEGANVVVIPDNDTTGYQHALMILNSLYWICPGVKFVIVPKPYKDISQWIEAGATQQQIDDLINDAPFTAPRHVIREYEKQINKLKLPELLVEINILKTNSLPRDQFKVSIIEHQLKLWGEAITIKIRKKGGINLNVAT